MEVTDDFLTLDKNTVTNCQNDESLEDCKTREYSDALIEQCKCLPFAIQDGVQARLMLFLNIPSLIHLILGPLYFF